MPIKKCYILAYPTKRKDWYIGKTLSRKMEFVKKLGYIPVTVQPRDFWNYIKQLHLHMHCDCMYIRKVKYSDETFINDLLMEAINNNMNLISKHGLKQPDEDKRDYQPRIC